MISRQAVEQAEYLINSYVESSMVGEELDLVEFTDTVQYQLAVFKQFLIDRGLEGEYEEFINENLASI